MPPTVTRWTPTRASRSRSRPARAPSSMSVRTWTEDGPPSAAPAGSAHRRLRLGAERRRQRRLVCLALAHAEQGAVLGGEAALPDDRPEGQEDRRDAAGELEPFEPVWQQGEQEADDGRARRRPDQRPAP